VQEIINSDAGCREGFQASGRQAVAPFPLGGHSDRVGLVSSGFPKAKPTFVTRPE